MNKLKEWGEQLKVVFEKKTIDAIFPPIIFYLINQWSSLKLASVLTLLYLIGLLVYRKVKHHPEKYALIGVAGVLISIGLSLLSGEAIDYYLPDLMSTAVIVVACFGSLIFHRPLAALLSHLTRGWPLAWYNREDIQPAYRYVTIIWGVYFLIRFLLQGYFYLTNAFSAYFFINTIFGMPMNILILIISYVTGVKTLHKLSGPSVEEFLNNASPPFQGQKNGF